MLTANGREQRPRRRLETRAAVRETEQTRPYGTRRASRIVYQHLIRWRARELKNTEPVATIPVGRER